MKHFILLSLIHLSLWAHGQRVHTAPIERQSEDLRVQLMRTESEVYGDFHILRTFHSDLFQSINSSDKAPYPALKSLFDTLFFEANATVGARVNYDTTYWAIHRAIAGRKKIKLSVSFGALYETFAPMPELLPLAQQKHRDAYFDLRRAYQDSCHVHGIVRYDPQQYAALLSIDLFQWQDSLEEVGRMIARCKADLKQRFPAQRGKEFFNAYAPVSQMEVILKNVESILNQLQNALSRFEEGNSQDFIYFGPQVRQRLEVSVNDDLIGQLTLQMSDCHSQEKEYFEQR